MTYGFLIKKITTFLFAAVFFVNAESFSIKGEQDGTYDKGEYIVNEDVIVKEGTSLTLLSGVVFRFRPYTGLVVKGDLLCKGSPVEPVVFTSSKDNISREALPEPFDWNGIKVEETSNKISLDFTRISFSTSGLNIKSDKTGISIANTVFKDNGNSNLIIQDDIINVKDNIRFEFSNINNPEKSLQNSEAEELPAKNDKWKLPVRISLGALVLASGIAAAVTHAKYEDYQEKANDPQNSDAQVDFEKGDTMVNLSNISKILCITSAIGFGVTFFF